MSIPHENGRCRSNGVSIFYRKLGRRGAVPVLLVHGLSYFSYDWLPIAQALGEDREVAAMDMRGFGDSDWSREQDYAVGSMAADIVSLLDHLGWERVVLCGHSMGGRSTTYAAARNPERAAGLVLVDYSPENAPAGSKRVAQTVAGVPEGFTTVEEAMRYFGADPDSLGARQRFEAYLKQEGEGFVPKRDPYFRDQFRRLLQSGERPKLGVDMWQLIGEVKCPILSMRGSRSDMYEQQTMQKMKAANARLQVVEIDAGHNIAGENAAGFLAAIRPFLATLS